MHGAKRRRTLTKHNWVEGRRGDRLADKPQTQLLSPRCHAPLLPVWRPLLVNLRRKLAFFGVLSGSCNI